MISPFFTTDDGDVILHASSESGSTHDFRVHRLILCLGSPVFKDMFSFPQPPDQSQNEQLGIPTINVPDSPEVLDAILRFICPGAELPKFTDLSALPALLSGADKYSIPSMSLVLRNTLKTFIPAESFRVYIIARRFGFLEEAKAAAMTSTWEIISRNVHEKEVRHISSVELYRLVWFVIEREASGLSKIGNFVALDPHGYYNPCPVEEHWSGSTEFYVELGKRLRCLFMQNPCVQSDGFIRILDMLPDPPLGCEPGCSNEEGEIECPLQPSFIRVGLNGLVIQLHQVSCELLEEAFEKGF